MKIIRVDLNNPNYKALSLAVKTMKKGGVVIYPTDTAYGIGVNATNIDCIEKLYELKRRDLLKPTHVIVDGWEMVKAIAKENIIAKKLFEQLMPGPLTIILSKKSTIPNTLTANLPTIGIRKPKNTITHALSHNLDFPYTTPSANVSGGKTPYTISDVVNQLDNTMIDLILDAGKLPQILPSTIVDTTKFPPTILRRGPVTRTGIEKVLGLTI